MCRPYEKAGQFPMATLIRLAALGTFPLGGGRLSGGHMGPPLRQIENGCVFLVGAGPRPARPGFAPGALVRQSQAQILNRKCSKFCRLRPPVGPEGIAPEHSWFCAPELFCLAQGVTPVNGGPGVRRLLARSAQLEPSPVAFCLLCRHGQSRSPPAGGETTLRTRNPI